MNEQIEGKEGTAQGSNDDPRCLIKRTQAVGEASLQERQA